ncbi:MAG: aminotransferase class I/II-fold pyridoxal phosphate-dependent enzyme [Verrucomicrobiae bacterium]|nr:aminotransferase class I/II-fold pyridoxal phosphate-dependent enzyme [Verrucomicrobiae bacterium]
MRGKKRRTKPITLVRPLVRKLKAYVPGEQPATPGFIKLNTNENPYPPSPKVLEAIKAAVDGRLRLYPNPTAEPLRRELARFHNCQPENIIVGNGSDELLAIATRAFVEPVSACTGPPRAAKNRRAHDTDLARSLVQYFTPSYSLYPVLADIHGARRNPVPLRRDFGLPRPDDLRHDKRWNWRAALTFITTPNAPTGRGYTTSELEALCSNIEGVVVLDETYVDFAPETALELAFRYPHVIVSRTFSKAYSLCFQRVGYMVGHADLIAAMLKIKDSYNVNGLGQIAALATLSDLEYYRENFRKIVQTRERLRSALETMGFRVFPSATNFLFVHPPRLTAREWLERLRERRILVRWFDMPRTRDFLRISVGTDAETDALIRAVQDVLQS